MEPGSNGAESGAVGGFAGGDIRRNTLRYSALQGWLKQTRIALRLIQAMKAAVRPGYGTNPGYECGYVFRLGVKRARLYADSSSASPSSRYCNNFCICGSARRQAINPTSRLPA